MSNDHATPAELRGVPRTTYARSHAVLLACDQCYGPIEPDQRGPLCGPRADWARYWAGLTDSQRAAFLAARPGDGEGDQV